MFYKLIASTALGLMLVAFSFVGCESPTSMIEPKLGEQFEIGYGQSATVREAGLENTTSVRTIYSVFPFHFAFIEVTP